MTSPKELGFIDVERLLVRLGPVAEELVLVGGQAVNFWAQFLGAAPSTEPLTSKDIDFCGTAQLARRVARALDGRVRVATMDDVTPNTGVVTFVDDRGIERHVDFLDAPFGLEERDVMRTALKMELFERPAAGAVQTFRVMHPVLLMESRVHNTAGLPGYDTPHALHQLRVAVRCARAFLLMLLDRGEGRAVLRLAERVFRFAHGEAHALEVFARHDIDAFNAVPADDGRLPKAFRERRLPQMIDWLRRRRQRYAGGRAKR